MKKILTLLIVLIMCVSCVDVYRTDDYFVVYSKEMQNGTYQSEYKYDYKVNHFMTTSNGDFYLNNYYIHSNDNYELGDTKSNI
jgi:hypothetical protein